MKRFFLLFVATVAIFTLGACSDGDDGDSGSTITENNGGSSGNNSGSTTNPFSGRSM